MADIIYPRNNPHRRNRDGSWDSICLTCFATVATTPLEPDLAEQDRLHVCTAHVLSQRSSEKLSPNGKATLAEIKKLLEESDPTISVTEFIPSPLVKKVFFH
jgi:hypothetical protein